MWAVFHKRTGKQLCKSHPNKDIVLIEAYELGLIVRAKHQLYLSQAYEIRRV